MNTREATELLRNVFHLGVKNAAEVVEDASLAGEWGRWIPCSNHECINGHWRPRYGSRGYTLVWLSLGHFVVVDAEAIPSCYSEPEDWTYDPNWGAWYDEEENSWMLEDRQSWEYSYADWFVSMQAA